MNASATGDVPRGTVVARGVARVAARGVARDGTRSRSTRAHHHLGSGFSNLFFRVVAASGRRDSPVVSATSSARIREYLSWPPAQILARPVGFFFLPRQPPVVRGLTRTPQTDGAHRTFASSSKHSRKAKSTLARRPARAPTARECAARRPSSTASSSRPFLASRGWRWRTNAAGSRSGWPRAAHRWDRRANRRRSPSPSRVRVARAAPPAPPRPRRGATIPRTPPRPPAK